MEYNTTRDTERLFQYTDAYVTGSVESVKGSYGEIKPPEHDPEKNLNAIPSRSFLRRFMNYEY